MSLAVDGTLLASDLERQASPFDVTSTIGSSSIRLAILSYVSLQRGCSQMRVDL
jgi:hypothetical protein